jgi:putative copper export protein
MAEWLEISAKILAYVTAIVAVGVVGTRWLLARVSSQLPGMGDRAERQLDGLFLFAGLVFLVAIVLRAWTHTATAFGFGDAFSYANLHLIAIESGWGGGWQQQAVAAVFVVTSGLYQRRAATSTARAVAGTAAVITCFALARTGHAASEAFGWLLHGVHVLAAGLWVGTLVDVLLVSGRRSPFSRQDAASLRVHLLRRFAVLAAGSVATLVVTGGTAAWLYLGAFSNLWNSDYGRALSLKLLLVAAMGLLGAVNWFRLHRRAEGEPPRTVLMEVGLALMVIVVTGWLTETAHP